MVNLDKNEIGSLDAKGVLLRKDENATDVALGFASWRQPSSERPVISAIEVVVESDGTNAGTVAVDVDESGGTTADYSFTEKIGASLGGSNTRVLSFYIPAGAQYQVRNVSDPTGNNAVNVVKEYTL